MIVIPMAGLSSRFLKAGYIKPKYMLEAHGKSLFEHSVNSFRNYFQNTKFLFILNDQFNSESFVEKKIKILGIKDYIIINLNRSTRGQAETVYLGLKKICYNGEITIFNIDTLRIDFSFPINRNKFDGFIDVFLGKGKHWSFIKTTNIKSKLITQTSEKRRISNLCCTGLYHFNNLNDFFITYNHYISLPKKDWEKGELYVAPLYNYLFRQLF